MFYTQRLLPHFRRSLMLYSTVMFVETSIREILDFHGGNYEGYLCSGMLRRVFWRKFTDISKVFSAWNIRAVSAARVQ